MFSILILSSCGINMRKTKEKGITYTPPTKKRLPQLYKLKETTTTRGSRSSWVKDSWARKTRSVTSSPTKSPSKHISGSPHLLYEGANFDFDQGDIPQPKFPKSLASNSRLHFQSLGLPDRLCSVCKKDGVYRCHGCFNEPLFCTDCCRIQHQRHPFHRISQWTGSFFQETSLLKVGLHIHLAHDGTPCPSSSTDYSSDVFQWSDTNDDIDDDYPEGPFIPPVRDPDQPVITIVDKSGVHSLSICYCHCPGALSRDMQLFQAGLFPASFTRPKTAFTFTILDNFLLDNLECGTSAMNYYSKIRRLTSSVFPLMVPVS